MVDAHTGYRLPFKLILSKAELCRANLPARMATTQDKVNRMAAITKWLMCRYSFLNDLLTDFREFLPL